MPPKKRALEDASPNVSTRSSKTRKTSNTDISSGKPSKPATSTAQAKPSKARKVNKPSAARGKKAQRQEDVENVEPEATESETQTEEGTLEKIEDPEGETQSSEEEQGNDKVSIVDKDPYEYILMKRPPHDFEAENFDKPAEEHATEEELEEQFKEQNEGIKQDLLASSKPDWKWVLMRGAWIKFADAMREVSYRSPDMLGMYIYNDFEGYGQLELVENHVQDFATEYAKKDADLKKMWIQLTGLVHFMKSAQLMPLGMIDDGQRLSEFITLLGCAYLTMLNALDRANQLRPDSEFQDLGLVSALYMSLPSEFADSYADDVLDWGQHIRTYCECYKLDTTAVSGSEELEFSDDPFSDFEGIPKAGPDRWNFKKTLAAYKKRHSTTGGRIGGKQYDITKMSRAQRKSYAFDKKDPLAHVPDKVLNGKEGVLWLR